MGRYCVAMMGGLKLMGGGGLGVVYGMGGGDVCVWCRRMIVGEL